RRDSMYGNVRLRHTFSDSLILSASYAHTRNEADFKEMFVIGLGDDGRTLERAVFVGKDTWEADRNLLLDIAGEFRIGATTHRFVAGVSQRWFDGSRPTRFYLTTPLDLFEPVYGQAEDLDPALRGFLQELRADEAFFQDRIQMGERLN